MRIERQGPVALLRLESGKVNAIGPDFIAGLNGLLDQLGDASAAVITGRGGTFSAGIDLPALVHDVFPEADLIEKALQRAHLLASLPPSGVRQVKAAIRRPVADLIRTTGAAHSSVWVQSWLDPASQRNLRAAVSRLKQR